MRSACIIQKKTYDWSSNWWRQQQQQSPFRGQRSSTSFEVVILRRGQKNITKNYMRTNKNNHAQVCYKFCIILSFSFIKQNVTSTSTSTKLCCIVFVQFKTRQKVQLEVVWKIPLVFQASHLKFICSIIKDAKCWKWIALCEKTTCSTTPSNNTDNNNSNNTNDQLIKLRSSETFFALALGNSELKMREKSETL